MEALAGEATCRVCGCTDEQACAQLGEAVVAGETVQDAVVATCEWTEPDLCSACTPDGPLPGWIHPSEQEGVEILAPDPHGPL